uniref:Uncharacterized protein n=1 Tax=Anopheles melas TaxID=34690 RepID=A0A182TCW8_9DIPT
MSVKEASRSPGCSPIQHVQIARKLDAQKPHRSVQLELIALVVPLDDEQVGRIVEPVCERVGKDAGQVVRVGGSGAAFLLLLLLRLLFLLSIRCGWFHVRWLLCVDRFQRQPKPVPR